MLKLKHLIKYAFSSAYRFRCNFWHELKPQIIIPEAVSPLTKEQRFLLDVSRLKALRQQIEADAKEIASLLVELKMAKWKGYSSKWH